ncbi:MAG: hypothetical protein GX575_13805 [Candidatus Anammoximicrobium sp.]|nr:hypothetical protein [Candidatus Anammoximicrobium sp.]
MPTQTFCDKKNAGDLMPPSLCGLTALLLLLLAAPPSVCGQAARWPDEYQVGQFLCHADFPLMPYRPLLDSMPTLERDLIQALALRPSREPIYVFLFHTKQTYQSYLRQYFPDAPSRQALFIKDRGLGMIFAHVGDAFELDLRHECTHALLNAILPVTPLWLDEGLAEYFEVAAEERAGGNPHGKYVKFSAYLGQIPGLEELEQLRDVSQMTRTRYRHAWAWVHFLLHGPPEAREELRRFLADLQALTPPGLLSRRLRQRLPDLDARFAEHCRKWKL